ACVRLSGADVIFGGELHRPIDDSEGVLGTYANLKGFACEYMTSGRVVILGDPGPYAFAGMTGGVVYQQLSPEMGLDERALRRRIGRGAKVAIQPLDDSDIPQLQRSEERRVGKEGRARRAPDQRRQRYTNKR